MTARELNSVEQQLVITVPCAESVSMQVKQKGCYSAPIAIYDRHPAALDDIALQRLPAPKHSLDSFQGFPGVETRPGDTAAVGRARCRPVLL